MIKILISVASIFMCKISQKFQQQNGTFSRRFSETHPHHQRQCIHSVKQTLHLVVFSFKQFLMKRFFRVVVRRIM